MLGKRKAIVPVIKLFCDQLYENIDCIRSVIKTNMEKEDFNQFLCNILERIYYPTDLIDHIIYDNIYDNRPRWE